MYNAVVTLKRNGKTVNATTGRKVQGSQTTYLAAQPCVFSQDASGSRSSFSSGVRDSTKPSPGLVLDDVLTVEILPGDIATVAWSTPNKSMSETFTVDFATLSVGILSKKWFLSLSRIQTP